MSQQKYRQRPELRTGIRVQYVDEGGAVRAERIHSRHGSTITVINTLKRKKRIAVEKVRGYWQPKVKASPANLVLLEK